MRKSKLDSSTVDAHHSPFSDGSHFYVGVFYIRYKMDCITVQGDEVNRVNYFWRFNSLASCINTAEISLNTGRGITWRLSQPEGQPSWAGIVPLDHTFPLEVPWCKIKSDMVFHARLEKQKISSKNYMSSRSRCHLPAILTKHSHCIKLNLIVPSQPG